MSKQIPFDIRRQIISLVGQGKTQKSIAEEVGYTERGVRNIIHKFRKSGAAAYQTQYRNCGKNFPNRYDDSIITFIEAEANSERGAPYIYSVLVSKYPDKIIPHCRTIQRWWLKINGPKPRTTVAARSNERWTNEPHHTWQIDGKEQIKLSGDNHVSWMNVADEATSTELQVTVFPPEAGS
jgi:hypothetical protein